MVSVVFLLAQLGSPSLLADLKPTSSEFVSPGFLCELPNGLVITTATPGSSGEPAFLDLATGATRLIADLSPGRGDSPLPVGTLGRRCLFFATDTTGNRALMATEGTTSTTHVLWRSLPFVQSATIELAGSAAFVAVKTPALQLLRTDGTPEGTSLVGGLVGPLFFVSRLGPALVVSNPDGLWSTTDGSPFTRLAPALPAGAEAVVSQAGTLLTVANGQVHRLDTTAARWLATGAHPPGSPVVFVSASAAAILITNDCLEDGCTLHACSVQGPSFVPSGNPAYENAFVWNTRTLAVRNGCLFPTDGVTETGPAIFTPCVRGTMLTRWGITAVDGTWSNGSAVFPPPVAGLSWQDFGDGFTMGRSPSRTVLFDGVTLSEVQPVVLPDGVGPSRFLAMRDRTLFTSSTRALWGLSSDGGATDFGALASDIAGTATLAITTPTSSAQPAEAVLPGASTLEALSDFVRPLGRPAVVGAELWFFERFTPGGLPFLTRFDGSLVPRRFALPVEPLTTSPISVGAQAFFTARTVFGEELWRTDGTDVGTLELDLRVGAESSAPEQLVAVGDRLAFSALDEGGRELWLSDGTRQGTRRAVDLSPGRRGSTPTSLVALGDTLLFFADDGTTGRELYRWTTSGPERLSDFAPGAAGVEVLLAGAGVARAFFSIRLRDGSQRLVVSDGTSAGTQLVATLDGNTFLHPVNGALLFDNTTLAHGRELWGWWPGLTEARMLADLLPGPASSLPTQGARLGRGVAFGAVGPGVGAEPHWVSVDDTPPEVTVLLNGAAPTDEVLRGDVEVRFTVTDPESPPFSTGCEARTITTDTKGTTLKCRADSAGGTVERAVVVRRDGTPPVLTCPEAAVFSGGALALDVTVTDTVDPSPVVRFEPPLERVTPLTESVTVTATDRTGSSTSCVVPVTVEASPPVKRAVTSRCEVTPGSLLSLLALVALASRHRRLQHEGPRHTAGCADDHEV